MNHAAIAMLFAVIHISHSQSSLTKQSLTNFLINETETDQTNFSAPEEETISQKSPISLPSREIRRTSISSSTTRYLSTEKSTGTTTTTMSEMESTVNDMFESVELMQQFENTSFSTDFPATLNFLLTTGSTADLQTHIQRKSSDLPPEFNRSNPCEFVKCKNGAKCVFHEGVVWCNCTWANSGFLCENALPVYLILALIGAGLLILFLFGMLIFICIKNRSKRIKQNNGFLDKKLNLMETFNKPDSCAVYADPSNYHTAGTPSSQCTIPRPRLILESFDENEKRVEYSNGYATFKRTSAAPSTGSETVT